MKPFEPSGAGDDAVNLVRQSYERKLASLEEFVEWGRGTDRDDYVDSTAPKSLDK